MDCEHEEIVEGECVNCGIIFRGSIEKRSDFTINHPKINQKTKTYTITKLKGIPTEVKRKAMVNLTREGIKNSFI